MWVVKIGGSMQESSCLMKWLDSLLTYGAGKVVIVPGGGKFADAVRQDQARDGFDDVKAHKMALRAMEKYAQLLVSIVPEFQLASDTHSIHACLADNKIAVWLPCKMIEREPGIPASWDVTSDGLAVWLAIHLQFKSVILVKSTALPRYYSELNELVELGLIDPYLAHLLGQFDLNICWMQKRDSSLLPTVIKNEYKFNDNNSICNPAVRLLKGPHVETETIDS